MKLSTVLSKLEYIKTIKSKIKTSIINWGIKMPEDTLFMDYSKYIKTIDKGELGSIPMNGQNRFANITLNEGDRQIMPYVKVTNARQMFYNSTNVGKITFDASECTDFVSTFERCDATEVDLDTSKGLNFSSFASFYNKNGNYLEKAKIDLSSATDINQCFYYAWKLQDLEIMNVREGIVLGQTNYSAFFPQYSTFKPQSLKRLKIHNNKFRGAMTLANCSFERDGILEIFNDLPVIGSDETTTNTITLTGNPGASSLTSEDIAIASSKGWSVTL
jgi:hypothetical protein